LHLIRHLALIQSNIQIWVVAGARVRNTDVAQALMHPLQVGADSETLHRPGFALHRRDVSLAHEECVEADGCPVVLPATTLANAGLSLMKILHPAVHEAPHTAAADAADGSAH